MLLIRVVPVCCLALALAGCGSVGAISFPSFGKKTAEAEPADAIDPAAVPPVERSQLPPPPTPGQAPMPQDGQVAEALPNGADASTGQEALPTSAPAPAPAASGTIGRTDLLGGWTISSSGDSCQLFMTLTSWTGGYRASTRGCTSDALKSISAWNLDGKQVVLAGQGGVTLARLSSSGGNRFDGSTEGGGAPVTFYR